MKFYIQQPQFLKIHEFEISENQFYEYKMAKEILSLALSIEEIFEIIISNFIELEKDLHSRSIEFILRNNNLYNDSFEDRVILNRRLINILTSVRLYTDYISTNKFHFLKNGPKNFKEFLEKEYDQNKYYRFMETLRNHVQHGGLAVHLITHNSKSIGEIGNSYLEKSLDFYSSQSKLLENPKVKKKVLYEFEDKIDLKKSIRSYIESIGLVQSKIRDIIYASTTESRSVIEQAHLLYKQKFNESSGYISACAIQEKKIVESIPLLLDWDDVRLNLLNRNKNLLNLSKTYISGTLKT